MTTKIYINTTPPDGHTSVKEAFPSAALAKKKATEHRRRGDSTLIEEITLNKMPKKDLLCALFNHQFGAFTDTADMVKVLPGMKKPKKVVTEDDGA